MSKVSDRDSKYAGELYWGLARMGMSLEEWKLAGLDLLALKLYPPKEGAADWSGIVTAVVEGTKCVAFVSSPRPEDVMRIIAAGLENGSLKWREDKYAK